MKVQQLIEELKKHPPEMRVILQGYESGFDDLSRLELMEIVVNYNDDGHSWWNGKHAPASQMLPPTAKGDEQALLIS
jgi:hypothetical protein